jgi:hypothetical protein
MAKRPAMKEVPTSKRMKGSGGSTDRYFSMYASKPRGMQDAELNKIDKIDLLLQEARELACMLLAVKYGASRPCEHTLVKRYPPGLRDNNEYDLVCTRCGKSF